MAGRGCLDRGRVQAASQGRLPASGVGTGECAEPGAWAAILDALTRRSAGRRTRLDVDDPSIGAQAQEQGYAFLGASYDRHDRRVEIMLGDPERLHYHLTRSVPHVDVLALDCTPDGRDRALRLEHDGGRTVLSFDD